MVVSICVRFFNVALWCNEQDDDEPVCPIPEITEKVKHRCTPEWSRYEVRLSLLSIVYLCSSVLRFVSVVVRYRAVLQEYNQNLMLIVRLGTSTITNVLTNG